jgi:hypothetical protein
LVHDWETSFEKRQARRTLILERITLAAQVLFILYLAAHTAVAWQAYREDGAATAILTFLLLGFGDLYWALRWLSQEEQGSIGLVALVSALTCFASWTFRPWFNAWIMRHTLGMLQDFSREMETLARQAEDRNAHTTDTTPENERDEIAPGEPRGGQDHDRGRLEHAPQPGDGCEGSHKDPPSM